MLRPLSDSDLATLLAVPGPLQFLFATAPWTGSRKSRVFCTTGLPGRVVFYTVVFAPTPEARQEWELSEAEMFLSAFAQRDSQLAMVTQVFPLSSDQPSASELAEKTHLLFTELSPFIEAVCAGVPLDTAAGEHVHLLVSPRDPPSNKLPDPSLN